MSKNWSFKLSKCFVLGKNVQNCPKLSRIVQNCPELSKTNFNFEITRDSLINEALTRVLSLPYIHVLRNHMAIDSTRRNWIETLKKLQNETNSIQYSLKLPWNYSFFSNLFQNPRKVQSRGRRQRQAQLVVQRAASQRRTGDFWARAASEMEICSKSTWINWVWSTKLPVWHDSHWTCKAWPFFTECMKAG